MSKGITTLVIAFMTYAFATAATIHVPKDYSTIQGGIDAAAGGDTVLVAAGVYVENIDFKGKAVTVKGDQGFIDTVIDGNQAGSVVTFDTGEGAGSILEGFTLRNGSGTVIGVKTYGGGIYISIASPTIRENRFTDNQANYGGGVYALKSSMSFTENLLDNNVTVDHGAGIYMRDCQAPVISNNTFAHNKGNYGAGIYLTSLYVTLPRISNNILIGNSGLIGGAIFHESAHGWIENNIISDNEATAYFGWGGGIYLSHYASPEIRNNLIQKNWANYGGGGIYVTYNSAPLLLNNTITENMAEEWGGGLCCMDYSSVDASDSILWNNSAPKGNEIYIGQVSKPSLVDIHHCDVEGGQAQVFVEPGCTLNWGAGMMDADPLFSPGPDGFYYLCQVAAGQPADSPCKDAGSDLAANLGMDAYWTRTDEVPDSGTVDLGYHYGSFPYPVLQRDASKIPEGTGGSVNFLLRAGASNANRSYLLIGSVSGMSPGTPLPGGKVTLPLNFDVVTNLVINLVNTNLFKNFMATLDGTGRASAQMNLGPVPGSSWLTLYFAYGLNKPWDFVSNPVTVEIVP